jgi:hypothetical protein
MISEKKLEANRRNAQLSTGPTSPEGRKAVSRNAVTHGLRARHVVTLAERPAEFLALWADLEAEWDPQTHAERFLVEQLAVIQFKLGRWEAVESAAVLQSTTVCLAFHDLREYETEKGTVRIPDTIDKREDQVNRTLDRYSQFTCRLERSWYKALETLQHLQDRRERKSRGKQHPMPAPVELPIAAAAGAAVAAAAQAAALDPAPSRERERPVIKPDFSAPSRAVEVPSRPFGPPDCV